MTKIHCYMEDCPHLIKENPKNDNTWVCGKEEIETGISSYNGVELTYCREYDDE